MNGFNTLICVDVYFSLIIVLIILQHHFLITFG